MNWRIGRISGISVDLRSSAVNEKTKPIRHNDLPDRFAKFMVGQASTLRIHVHLQNKANPSQGLPDKSTPFGGACVHSSSFVVH